MLPSMSGRTSKTKRSRMMPLDWLLGMGVVALFAASNAGCWLSWPPQLDLLAHFQVQYLWLTLALLTCCLLRRHWTLACAAVVVAALPMSRLVPWYTAAPGDCNGPTIRLLSANVGWFNNDHTSFLNLVRQVDPDIVIVQEATEVWAEALQTLTNWPYVVGHPQDGPFGMVLRSRLPLRDARVHEDKRDMPPVLTATVDIDGRPLSITAVHPMRPGPRHGGRLRDAQLNGIASIAQALESDGIVLGDLNTTMWTDGYTTFEQAVQGRNLRRGRGIMPSWQRGFPWLLSIPIDHALIRGAVCCKAFELRTVPGSDHAALLVDIGLHGP